MRKRVVVFVDVEATSRRTVATLSSEWRNSHWDRDNHDSVIEKGPYPSYRPDQIGLIRKLRKFSFCSVMPNMTLVIDSANPRL